MTWSRIRIRGVHQQKKANKTSARTPVVAFLLLAVPCSALPQPRVTCPSYPRVSPPLFFDFGLSISFCQFKETLAISGQAASLFRTSFCFEQCQRRQRWWHIFNIHFQSIRCPKKTWPGWGQGGQQREEPERCRIQQVDGSWSWVGSPTGDVWRGAKTLSR